MLAVFCLELYDRFTVHFTLIGFVSVSTYLLVLDAEKVICYPCKLINWNSKSLCAWCSRRLDLYHNSMHYSYYIVVCHTNMKHILLKYTKQIQTFVLWKSIVSNDFFFLVCEQEEGRKTK